MHEIPNSFGTGLPQHHRLSSLLNTDYFRDICNARRMGSTTVCVYTAIFRQVILSQGEPARGGGLQQPTTDVIGKKTGYLCNLQ